MTGPAPPSLRALATRLHERVGRRLSALGLAGAVASIDTAAAARIAALPAYQVALWPDGWCRERDGGVRVQDTHAMAEARRWYRLAARHADPDGARGRERLMGAHGVFVPRAIVDLPPARFATEPAASVALRLIAGDWIAQRRRRLLADPLAALAARERAWCGSRCDGAPAPTPTRLLVERLIAICRDEGLWPADAAWRLDVQPDDGWGIAGVRVTVHAVLDRPRARRAEAALRLALLPWNRGVIRDGSPTLPIQAPRAPTPLISVRVLGIA